MRKRLAAVLAAWGVWVVFALGLLFAGEPPLGLIPEPANTILFVLSGLGLAAFLGGPDLLEWVRIQRALMTARSIDDLRRLSPADFEELIAAYFRQYGFRVRRTGRSGDHGVDLVVYTRKQGKWIVQCKRWKGQVGEPAVRELYGAMHHEGARRAFLMTSGGFTPQALAWAKGKPITLYDGQGLVRLIRRVQKRRK